MSVSAPTYDRELPPALPIFPLSGVLLLPGGQLPLNIFEPRYIAMTEDALRTDRLIGMIQPREPGGKTLFRTGCAGKISSFTETEDGCFNITLTGVSRFDVAEEMETISGYRRIRPDWTPYADDLSLPETFGLDRGKFLPLLKKYLSMQDMECSWDHVEQAPDRKLVTCLSIICPFDAGEKQALLEAPSLADRAALLTAMLEIAVKGVGGCSGECH